MAILRFSIKILILQKRKLIFLCDCLETYAYFLNYVLIYLINVGTAEFEWQHF